MSEVRTNETVQSEDFGKDENQQHADKKLGLLRIGPAIRHPSDRMILP
jgi:hypothetical protein